MRSLRLILTPLIILIYNLSIGQTTNSSIYIDGFKFPKPSTENMIQWVNLSTKAWEKEMKTYQFKQRGIEEGCIFYGSSSSLNDAVYSVDKCLGNRVSIMWNDFSRQGKTVLDDIIDELEPYYIEKIVGGAYKYGFNKDGNSYIFLVERHEAGEFVILTKL